jgi:hypothetical protein
VLVLQISNCFVFIYVIVFNKVVFAVLGDVAFIARHQNLFVLRYGVLFGVTVNIYIFCFVFLIFFSVFFFLVFLCSFFSCDQCAVRVGQRKQF